MILNIFLKLLLIFSLERSTVEENGMMDLMKERIKHLELQLRSQEEKFKQQVTLLESTLKEREILYKKSIPEVKRKLLNKFFKLNLSFD